MAGSVIADPALAPEGEARIGWADGQMPVLRSIRSRFAEERPLEGVAVAACLHVTAETAVLVRTLRVGGARVALCAANPLATQDDVAAALAADGAAAVLAVHGEGPDAWAEHVAALAAYGPGQSTLDGILRATNLFLAGRSLVVLGYGWTGRGVAQRARGAGASVIVCEVDPLRALEARMEGFEVMPALEAAERGDVFVTVTGGRDVLRREHFERMKDGAVLANAGHFDVEIDLEGLRALADEVRDVRPRVEQYVVGDRRLN